MNALKKYDIPFSGLSDGEHDFQFEIEQDFFDSFKNEDFSDSNVVCQVVLIKDSDHLILKFSFSGTVTLPCDRCLENYPQEVDSEYVLYVKRTDLSSPATDESKDVIFISLDETKINIAQWIYEFIHLSLPLRKTHPINENGEYACSNELDSYLKNQKEPDSDESEIDPRWEKLKNVKTDQ